MDIELIYEFDGDDYEYNADYSDACDVLTQEFAKDYGISEEAAKRIIDDYDLWESLEDCYNDVLLEYFEDEAYDAYLDGKDYSNDPYSYYGVNRNDFH